MSVLDRDRTRQPTEPEALIPEARQAQRLRYGKVIAAAVAALVVLGAAIFVATSSHSASTRSQGATLGSATVVAAAKQVTMRPVLCYVPAYVASSASAPSDLPSACAAPNQLLPGNLGTGTASADPSLSSLRSTPTSEIASNKSVLLSDDKGIRYLLGPVELRLAPASVVKSASATRNALGQWVVDYTLTSTGASKNDAVMNANFHKAIALVLDGTVFSAPVIQPSQSTFSSFQGQGEISGITQAQAKALAAAL